jgi:hypothetical protein
MPVYATRNLRNLAAALMLLSGLTHVGQLWFVKLNGIALLAALLGMFYLLISLGLSGQSRFSLWLATGLPAAAAYAAVLKPETRLLPTLWPWHIAADIAVPCLCLYILFRTRHSRMD